LLGVRECARGAVCPRPSAGHAALQAHVPGDRPRLLEETSRSRSGRSAAARTAATGGPAGGQLRARIDGHFRSDQKLAGGRIGPVGQGSGGGFPASSIAVPGSMRTSQRPSPTHSRGGRTPGGRRPGCRRRRSASTRTAAPAVVDLGHRGPPCGHPGRRDQVVFPEQLEPAIVRNTAVAFQATRQDTTKLPASGTAGGPHWPIRIWPQSGRALWRDVPGLRRGTSLLRRYLDRQQMPNAL
jgi:hypothetical protein